MGVNIVALKNIRCVASLDDDTDIPDAVRVWNPALFETRADGLVEGRYAGEWPPDREHATLRSFSYHGYNHFRDLICLGALKVSSEEVWQNARAFEGKPFYELIDFPDNEGAIGPRTSAKLAKDFRAWAVTMSIAMSSLYPDGIRRYGSLMRAFEWASENGVVVFM